MIDALLSGPLLGGALPVVTWIGALLTAAWPRSGLLGFLEAEDIGQDDDVAIFSKGGPFPVNDTGDIESFREFQRVQRVSIFFITSIHA